jgi:hypothetical protein
VQQSFRLERRVIRKRTGEVEETVIYGVTSLAPARAGAARLLRGVREHWHVENKSHWVRDVTFGEDGSQVRCGSIPQVLAALRNTVIGLLRRTGAPNLAAARRHYAAQPGEALALLGIPFEN